MPPPEQEPGPSVFSQAPQETYQQPMLTGMETEQPEQITLENCLVTARPIYTNQGKTHHWQCSLAAEPDIFHPDRNELVEVQTTRYAKAAYKKHLQPGDRVSVTGTHEQHELELANGEKKTVTFLLVSTIHVLSRAQRLHITVYEKYKK